MFSGLTVLAFVACAILGARYLARPLFLKTLYVMVAIDVTAVAVLTFFPRVPSWLGRAELLGIWLTLLFSLFCELRNHRAWTRDANHAPLELAPPFIGTWRVAAGGAWRARNHHQIASDQRFAYDFIRTEGDSFGSTILAPIAGRVVSLNNDAPDHAPSGRVIEDPQPFGNYVAIARAGATVFLVHLRSGSVCVRVGDEIEEGTPIGECGNSGRTSGPHLHIHAQDQMEPAPFAATGIPIAFRSANRASIAAYGDRLTG